MSLEKMAMVKRNPRFVCSCCGREGGEKATATYCQACYHRYLGYL